MATHHECNAKLMSGRVAIGGISLTSSAWPAFFTRGTVMTAAAAAILLRRERELVETFRAAGATSPPNAVSLSDLNLEPSIAFRRLQRRAVLRATESGLFYLDEPSWIALHGIRRQIVLVMLAVLILVLLMTLLGRRIT
jgi:hypothetical protein